MSASVAPLHCSNQVCLSFPQASSPIVLDRTQPAVKHHSQLHNDVQGSSLPAFESWKDYYMFRTWSLSDPTGMVTYLYIPDAFWIDQEKSYLQDSFSFVDSLADFAMESVRFCTQGGRLIGCET